MSRHVPALSFRLPPAIRRSRRARWIAAGVAAALLAGGGLAWRALRPEQPKEEFREHVVARGDLAVAVSAAGEVSPQNRIELNLPISGRIETILVREGDTIRKGQVLAWVSSYDRAAVVDAARAKGAEEAARWEDVYKPTPLVAPLAGFIVARRAEPGQTLGTGASASPLVMADRLIVRAQVDETDLAKVRVGQRAEVTLDAYPGAPLPGRVDHIAWESRKENNVTIYDIEVELRRSSGVLRSGMTATVSIVTAEKRGVLLVPAEALAERDGQLVVLRKRTGRPPEAVPVEIGLTDGSQVEIARGLAEGNVAMISNQAIPPSALSTASNPFAPRWGGSRPGGSRSGGTRSSGGRSQRGGR